MTNEKWKMRNGKFSVGLRRNVSIRIGRKACPANAFLQTRQRPTGLIVWAQWGEKSGKLRVQIIVGSGA
jgi:hypothetical protein